MAAAITMIITISSTMVTVETTQQIMTFSYGNKINEKLIIIIDPDISFIVMFISSYFFVK